MRLTSRNVRSLDAGEYRDAQVPGLILRVWDTGRAWSFRSTFRGERLRVDLGALERKPEKLAEHIDQTRDLARLLVAGMVRGEDPRVALRRHESDSLTVAMVCEQALTDLELRPATRKGWAGHIKRDIEPTLGSIPAANLTRAQIRKWGETIARRSGYSANRAFEVLRRAYSWAVENDVLTATPFVRLPKPFAKEAPRAHVPTVDELVGILHALDANPCGHANAVELLLLTGVRKNEAKAAKAAEFHGDTWRIPGARTKNAREHIVPLSSQAAAVFARQRRGISSTYLFPRVHIHRKGVAPKSPVFRLGSAFVVGVLSARAGSRVILHSFRHALATHGQDILGFDLSVVSAILGHVTPEISKATRVYARGTQLGARREALQAWADWLDSLRRRPRTGPKAAQ